MAYPIFFSQNYVNDECTVLATSNQSLAALAYDRDKSTQWVSTGETDEDGDFSTYLECQFYSGKYSVGAVAVQRTFDSLVILNTNLKNFKLQYHNGAAWVDIADSIVSTQATANVYIRFSTTYTAYKVRLAMDKTQTAGVEKTVGEWYVMLYKTSLDNHKTEGINHQIIEGGDNAYYRLANGTGEKKVLYTKEIYNFKSNEVTQTQRDVLKALKALNLTEPICFFLDYVAFPDDIIECNWTQPYNETYNQKTYRYSIEFHLEQK